MGIGAAVPTFTNRNLITLTDSKPPILTQKSLIIITKVTAIYAAFYIVTGLVKVFADPLENQPTVSVHAYDPLYVVAGIHLLVLLVTGACIAMSRYRWIITILSVIVVLLSRIFYEDIALWVWSWSA
ncbi:hypothetical protein [Nonlabens xiamenensis]|uniref:hypothetical protein n=1 Tax=Nonlabens xiamenensis TaxID=2341043 RepID=UPI000F60FC6D|nr:hypothetical protein [Nonlabens xiamenensis]